MTKCKIYDFVFLLFRQNIRTQGYFLLRMNCIKHFNGHLKLQLKFKTREHNTCFVLLKMLCVIKKMLHWIIFACLFALQSNICYNSFDLTSTLLIPSSNRQRQKQLKFISIKFQSIM